MHTYVGLSEHNNLTEDVSHYHLLFIYGTFPKVSTASNVPNCRPATVVEMYAKA